MLGFLGNRTCPIGVDFGDDALTLVQMGGGADGVGLVAADSTQYPPDIKQGSPQWQRWAIDSLGQLLARGGFQGKKATAALPPSEVHIDHMPMPKAGAGDLPKAIIANMRPRLQIAPDDVAMEYVKTEGDNILVMASERARVYRHLAIYEKVRLKVASISVWPTAVLKAYAHLWARHREPANGAVMLLDIAPSCTNIVICDSANLYFARSAPVGAKNLDIDRMVELLGSEMDLCRVKFRAAYKKAQVSHIIFVSGHAVDKDVYTKIAQRAQMSAQVGDCLDAVGAASPANTPDDQSPAPNWITAMGLSLS
ncbi:MAG: hypothetical protein JSU94_07710 [Phycisphaerales bacterium]|nr:MAG: hypothetical protein JSU94_07710 [Phycisphaerales bacterium]